MRAEGAAAETGHVGNLTPDQEKKLRQLWGLLLDAFEFDADAARHEAAGPQDPAVAGSREGGAAAHHEVGLGERAVRSAAAAPADDALRRTWLSMLKQENPDALLLRFLRARKWDVAQALAMLRAALLWRRDEARVDDEVLPKGEPWCAAKERAGAGQERTDAHDYLEQLRLGKVYLRGTDRRGRPVGYVRVALHRPGAQGQAALEKLVVQTIETARCLFTAAPPNESFCVVFDLTGFSLSNMEWQPARFVIRAFEANYPECLGTMLIHNAPWVFSGVWKIVRGLLDPVVAAKVDFTRSVDDLERYIPRENIPCALGGADGWRYVYAEPAEDEDAGVARGAAERERITAERGAIGQRFLAATRAWIGHVDSGEGEAAAAQEMLRREAAEALRVNYWALDPYVRSRTYLDRAGVIRPGGSIEFYPDRTAAAAAEDVKGAGLESGDAVGIPSQDIAVAI